MQEWRGTETPLPGSNILTSGSMNSKKAQNRQSYGRNSIVVSGPSNSPVSLYPADASRRSRQSPGLKPISNAASRRSSTIGLDSRRSSLASISKYRRGSSISSDGTDEKERLAYASKLEVLFQRMAKLCVLSDLHEEDTFEEENARQSVKEVLDEYESKSEKRIETENALLDWLYEKTRSQSFTARISADTLDSNEVSEDRYEFVLQEASQSSTLLHHILKDVFELVKNDLDRVSDRINDTVDTLSDLHTSTCGYPTREELAQALNDAISSMKALRNEPEPELIAPAPESVEQTEPPTDISFNSSYKEKSTELTSVYNAILMEMRQIKALYDGNPEPVEEGPSLLEIKLQEDIASAEEVVERQKEEILELQKANEKWKKRLQEYIVAAEVAPASDKKKPKALKRVSRSNTVKNILSDTEIAGQLDPEFRELLEKKEIEGDRLSRAKKMWGVAREASSAPKKVSFLSPSWAGSKRNLFTLSTETSAQNATSEQAESMREQKPLKAVTNPIYGNIGSNIASAITQETSSKGPSAVLLGRKQSSAKLVLPPVRSNAGKNMVAVDAGSISLNRYENLPPLAANCQEASESAPDQASKNETDPISQDEIKRRQIMHTRDRLEKLRLAELSQAASTVGIRKEMSIANDDTANDENLDFTESIENIGAVSDLVNLMMESYSNGDTGDTGDVLKGVVAPTEEVLLVLVTIDAFEKLYCLYDDSMKEALEIYRNLARSLLKKAGGYLVKMRNDAILVAFDSSSLDSMKWCLALQLTMLQAPWPQVLLDHSLCKEVYDSSNSLIYRGPRIKMAVHSGWPMAINFGENVDYIGALVHRLVGIAAAAKGGQILVSRRVHSYLVNDLNVDELDGAELIEIGEYDLEGLEAGDFLYQLTPAELTARSFSSEKVQHFSPSLTKMLQENFSLVELVANSSNVVSSEMYHAAISPVIGTEVSMVVCGVKGAASLWQVDERLARKCEAMYTKIVTSLCRKLGGLETKSSGDMHLIAFENSILATRFSIALHENLLKAEWPSELFLTDAGKIVKNEENQVSWRGLAATIVIHNGTLDALEGAYGDGIQYFGPEISMLLNIMMAAQVGQTICTPSSWIQLERHAEDIDGLIVVHLGEFHLAGLTDPIYLVQLTKEPTAQRCFKKISNCSRNEVILASVPERMLDFFEDNLILEEICRQGASLSAAGVEVLTKLADLEAPIGNIAVVFSDVKDLSKLSDSYPDEMLEATALYNALARKLLAEFNGYEFLNLGVTSLLAFYSPLDALNWCLCMQQQLLRVQWPFILLDGTVSSCSSTYDENGRVIFKGLRSSMGIHFGRPQVDLNPLSNVIDMFGDVVGRACRLGSLAAGGQVIMSRRTYLTFMEDISEVSSLSDGEFKHLGTFYAKNLSYPESIYQAMPRNLATRAFPLIFGGNDVVSNNAIAVKEIICTQNEASHLSNPFRQKSIVAVDSAQPPRDLVVLVLSRLPNVASLKAAFPKDMDASTKLYVDLCRRMLSKYRGYEVKLEEDLLMLAFHDVQSALQWCIVCQTLLLQEKWPASILEHPDAAEVYTAKGVTIFRGLRVGMSVHVGFPYCEIDASSNRMFYFGPMVERSAKLLCAAQGGQILLSESAQRHVRRLSVRLAVTLKEIEPKKFCELEGAGVVWQVLPSELSEREFSGNKLPLQEEEEARITAVKTVVSNSVHWTSILHNSPDDLLAVRTREAPRLEYPSNCMTGVLIDIDMKGKLVDGLREEYNQALKGVLQKLLALHRGWNLGIEDFCCAAAFPNVVDALRFCLSFQEQMLSYKWSKDVLAQSEFEKIFDSTGSKLLFAGPRFRVAVHVGTATTCFEENATHPLFEASFLSVAADILGYSQGGQVLVSERTWSHVNSLLDEIGNPHCRIFPNIALSEEKEEERITELLPLALSERIELLKMSLSKQTSWKRGNLDLVLHRISNAFETLSSRELVASTLTKSELLGAPVGEVALVFADVQGARKLWENHPIPMAESMRLCYTLFRKCIQTDEGYEAATEGDAFMIVFQSLTKALNFCLHIQEELQNQPWPDPLKGEKPLWKGLRVRMAIHYGSPMTRPQPQSGRMCYFGPMVEKGSEIWGLGRGGQILISRQSWKTASASASELECPVVTKLLGRFRLKGNNGYAEVMQVSPKSLADRNFDEDKATPEAADYISFHMMQERLKKCKVSSTISAVKVANQTDIHGFPRGEMALVVTDVQGSTLLWESKPAAMKIAISVHNICIRRVLDIFSGFEVKATGNAFMVAFHNVLDAAQFCLTVQAEMLNATWPPAILEEPDASELTDQDGNTVYRGLRVRMGMHVGYPISILDPTSHRVDYFGPMVKKTVRVMGSALGGQVLLSEIAANRLYPVRSQLPEHVIAPVGVVDLMGIEKSEQLTQILPKSLKSRALLALKDNPNPIEADSVTKKMTMEDSQGDLEALISSLTKEEQQFEENIKSPDIEDRLKEVVKKPIKEEHEYDPEHKRLSNLLLSNGRLYKQQCRQMLSRVTALLLIQELTKQLSKADPRTFKAISYRKDRLVAYVEKSEAKISVIARQRQRNLKVVMKSLRPMAESLDIQYYSLR